MAPGRTAECRGDGGEEEARVLWSEMVVALKLEVTGGNAKVNEEVVRAIRQEGVVAEGKTA